MTANADTRRRATEEVEAYVHQARAMVVEIFGGEPGTDQALVAVHLAAALVQADTAIRIAESNERLAAALTEMKGR